MPHKVFLCVNSDLGRGNTIGARFGHIVNELERRNISYTVVARANYTVRANVHVPWYKNFFGRFLNALHIYLLPGWDVRRPELYLFDSFVYALLKKSTEQYSVAHIGEYLPRTIALLKSRKVTVLLDIPIAHPAETDYLTKQGIIAGSPGEHEPMDYINKSIAAADLLIAPSQFVVDSVRRSGIACAFKIIPFGVQLPSLPPAFFAQREQEPIKTVLFTGTVNYRKGVAYLLAAWAESGLAQRSDVQLVLCGRVYAQIKPTLAQHQYKNVHCVGFTAVEPWYAQAHVFVLPSLIEGSAKAVYEAMSYGLPCIVTPNTGSVIQNEHSGLIVPAANTAALATALRRLCNDATEREQLGRAARVTAAQYSWEHYAQSVVTTYSV